MRTDLCFKNLIRFWYEYDKSRVKDYVENERGWNPEMVDEFKIGWADPEADEYQHLKGSGFSHEEIISTGAFTEDGNCLWNGRYVFPYYNENDNPVYAIARCTGDEGGGGAGYDGHPEDFLAGKYAKLSHTKDYVNVDEPIWGLQTMDYDKVKDVIICEGIADAMILDYHGFPVLSPVTTQFKDKHFEPLVDIFERKNVDNVYIIPDAEEVQDTTRYDVSAGVTGAVKSAYKIYQLTSDVNVNIAELPRPDNVDKVDVDDYLCSNKPKDLAKILKKSDEATELDIYDKIASDLDKTSVRKGHSADGIKSDSGSAIYDLTVVDLVPEDMGDRGRNPIDHKGSKENYFVLMDNGETAYDHKRKCAYNALTYILCEIGERDVDSPSGHLSDEDIWKAWVYAKDEGLVASDDPIPVRAMEYYAEDVMGYDVGSGMLETDVYNNVIESVDKIIDSGRDKITGGARRFYEDKSDYYNMDVRTVEELCSVTDDLDGFKTMDIVWTYDDIDGYVPALALVALEEGFINQPIELDWASNIPDSIFADLCKIAREKYLFTGKPPYRAIRGTAVEEDIINWNDKLGKSEYKQARNIFNS